tara:strand:- start:54 stop:692 length:639 start_codon:yes stop_codon:yes gene_type:complete
MDIQYKLIKNFGPSVFAAKIPEDIINKLNNYVDQLVEDQKKSRQQNYGENLVGDVTQEIKIDQNTIKETGWLKFLATCTKQWIELETKKKITQFNLKQSWVVRQFKNEYNPIHWHSGHISGAGFLKLPKSFGDFKQKKQNKKYCGGHLELIHGSRMFLSSSKFEIAPRVGEFYFFPNYLMHTVYPFKDTDEERRSISFNATIDDNIYNVYEY